MKTRVDKIGHVKCVINLTQTFCVKFNINAVYIYFFTYIFPICYANLRVIIVLYLSDTYSNTAFIDSCVCCIFSSWSKRNHVALITCALPVACNTLASAHDCKLGLNNKTRLHTPFGDCDSCERETCARVRACVYLCVRVCRAYVIHSPRNYIKWNEIRARVQRP